MISDQVGSKCPVSDSLKCPVPDHTKTQLDPTDQIDPDLARDLERTKDNNIITVFSKT